MLRQLSGRSDKVTLEWSVLTSRPGARAVYTLPCALYCPSSPCQLGLSPDCQGLATQSQSCTRGTAVPFLWDCCYVRMRESGRGCYYGERALPCILRNRKHRKS